LLDIQQVGGGEKRQAITSEERFERMYRQHEQRLLAYALRRAPVDAARDAVAETFLAAWRRFDELPEDPLPWLIGAARKTLANQHRSSLRQARLADRLAGSAVDRPGAAEESEDAAAVRAALERLRTEDREALTLIAWEGLTPSRAARSLGCSPVAFRVRLHRARRRFERALVEERERAGTDAWHCGAVGAKEAS
jgi:RNA polymerase sigma factor (sigma-70 family)